MKSLTFLSFFLSFLFFSTNTFAVTAVVETTPNATVIPKMTKAEMEETLGRKVKLNEWVTYKLLSKKAKKKRARRGYEGDGNGFAIAGMILGILGIVTLNLLFAILGIIFSATALAKIRRTGETHYQGMARAGLITGIIGCVLFLGLLSIVVAAGIL